jgi:hypothetical protein
MSGPDLHGDESVILTTPDVFVKSTPFEAVLTNKRIILVDRDNDLVPPKDIVLATIRDVQPGENAIHDQTISLSVVAITGGTRQIVLTFSAKAGGKRKRERDEWVTALQKYTRSSFQKAIRSVIPGLDGKRNAKSQDTAQERGMRPTLPPDKTSVDAVQPQKKIDATIPAAFGPGRTAALPEGSFCTRCGSRVPAGSLFCTRCGAKIIVPEQEPRPPGAHAGAPPATRPTPQPARAVQAKKKSPFALPQLFRRKERQPETNPRTPPSRGGRSGGFGKYTTILALIAVLIIALGGGAFVVMNFQNLTPSASGGGSPTGQKSATPTPTFVFIETTPVPVPAKGVWVRVSYLGTWSGSYGTVDALQSVTNSGDYLYEVTNPNKTIQATFKRADTSTRPHELIVEIYKDGALIKRGNTTVPQGSVDISVDPTPPKPAGTVTTAKTVTPVKTVTTAK